LTDAVFSSFAAAGLWPGLGKTLAGQLAEHGIATPDDVLPSKLAKLPSIGLVRAERLVEAFKGAADRYEVAALLVPAGLPARLAFRAIESLGPTAADRLRADPWRLLDIPEVRLIDGDRLAVSVLGADARKDDPRRGRAGGARAGTRRT
jgi:exodeoxyribonuclease V alpha subunit